jgi:hypothetical protein
MNAALRIFAHAPPRRSALARPLRSQPLPLVVADGSSELERGAPPIAAPHDTIETEVTVVIERDEVIALEPSILQALAAAPQYGETIEAGYRRKERELADLFGSLTRSEAATLQRRLSTPRDDDALARRFARLVVDRRARLLAILADTPRREALRR